LGLLKTLPGGCHHFDLMWEGLSWGEQSEDGLSERFFLEDTLEDMLDKIDIFVRSYYL
jgi:hypothetical protein